jgi:hypothetical protein
MGSCDASLTTFPLDTPKIFVGNFSLLKLSSLSHTHGQTFVPELQSIQIDQTLSCFSGQGLQKSGQISSRAPEHNIPIKSCC